MAQDRFYIFDKLTKKRTLLGEIQSDFNMSLTIDGTKDSLSVLVYSYQDYEIEPYTVCFHDKTGTYWIVSHDKIERYQNEQGFIYVHNLELLGAIELLNARDLTDCGFNNKTYTVRQFIERLFKLSNCEYDLIFDFYTNQNFLSKKVDFIKTFENYTLLSALREFLDAYNMCPKLSFTTSYEPSTNTIYLDDVVLKIISKTGDSSLSSHDISDFDGAKELKTMDKNSFGTCVVSNAENVISNKEKIYPSVGVARLSSTTKDITADKAVLRLPSKVFKGNWIQMTFAIFVNVDITTLDSRSYRFFPYDIKSLDKIIDLTYEYIMQDTLLHPADPVLANAFLEDIESKKQGVYELLTKSGSVTLYEGNKIVPTFSGNTSTITIKKGDNVPYLPYMSVAVGVARQPIIFTDKDTRQLLERPMQGIAWERGSDIISGFDVFGVNVAPGYNISQSDTDLQRTQTVMYEYTHPTSGKVVRFTVGTELLIDFKYVGCRVSYIPMSDIKVKVDNQRTKNDVQLYNQNGKITDNFALSKLLNSYSKEISSDNIVKTMQYTNYNDIPKIGSIVKTPKGNYVINNISMTFYQCESKNVGAFNYFIDCEFNMSKWVSTKSLMVNPNTNIRDYGIPQNFNVKRKQLYRDYYEINYNLNDDNEGVYYLDPQNIFSFSHYSNKLADFTALIKMTYKEPVGGDEDTGVDSSTTWYYQLESVNYYLHKMVYVMLDFKDNNIIGYGSQNVFSGFDLSRVFTGGLIDTLNTPISYVDNDGEAKGIEIKMLTKEQLLDVYDEYQNSSAYSDSYAVCLYNFSCFIPQYVYDNANATFEINEPNYYKDALEVPVFEYACQIDDSDDVLVGDNVLTQYEGNIVYFYGFVVGDNLTQDTVNDSNSIIATTHPIGWSQGNGTTIEYESLTSAVKLLKIKLYNWQRWDIDTIGFTNGPGTDISQLEGKDIAIFRKAFDLTNGKVIADDLLFIAKKIPSTNVSQDGLTLTLKLNHYKLN